MIAQTKAATRYGESYREKRACKGCGYVRVIKIVDILAGAEKVGELSKDHCRACELEQSAATHERFARKHREMARLIRNNMRRGKR